MKVQLLLLFHLVLPFAACPVYPFQLVLRQRKFHVSAKYILLFKLNKQINRVERIVLRPVVLVAIWCIFLMYFLLDISPKYAELALTSVILCIKFNVFFMLFWTLPQYIKKYPKVNKQSSGVQFPDVVFYVQLYTFCTKLDNPLITKPPKKQINKS